MRSAFSVLALLTSTVFGQVTLTPTTIRTGRSTTGLFPTTTVTETLINTVTETTTASYILRETTTATVEVTKTLPAVTVSVPVTTTATRTSVSTTTSISRTTTTVRTTTTAVVTSVSTKPCGPSVACPTVTSTATACRSCLVPQCTTTQRLTRPCGCDALPTAAVSFPCSDPNACNQIGCTTVYAIQTAAC